MGVFKLILKEDCYISKFVEYIIKYGDSEYGIIELSDGHKFIGAGNDYIPWRMFQNDAVYSDKEIETFFDLASQFYDVADNSYFFDCGCNILTTSVYAKHIKKDIKIAAFEPVKDTYDMARINAIINGIDKDIYLVNKGLSDKEYEATMANKQGNCGAASIVNESEVDDKELLEKVEIITLTKWCEQNKITPNDIGYIWIDVEGHEGFIIKDLVELLKDRKVPMYMEFLYDSLVKNRCLDMLVDNLKKMYTKFIMIGYGGTHDISDKRDIEELRNMKSVETNIFLIP